jgi:hypothetical protein
MKIMLKKIKDCKKEIKRGWKLKSADPDEIILENPKYGRLEVVANCDGGYDQIVQIEPTGAVIIVLVDEPRKKIYLHNEYRPAVPKNDAPKIKKDNLYIPFDYLGGDSIELVRGYSEGNWPKTAITEIKEETGYSVTKKDLKELGYIIKDTSTSAFKLTIALARHDSNENFQELSEEEGKKIKNRKWYNIKKVKEMINKNKIVCALTLAALNLYFQTNKIN